MSTPIEQSRNLGPATGAELRAIGIDTLEKLQAIGWENAYLRLLQRFPHRLHLMMCYALIGAEHDTDLRRIPADEKARARELNRELRGTPPGHAQERARRRR